MAVYATATAAAGLLLTTVWLAATQWGHAFPEMFVGPQGGLSTLMLPSWQPPAPLRFNDRVVAIDGKPIDAAVAGDMVSAILIERADAARAAGRPTIALRFATRDGSTITVERRLRRFGVSEVGFFFGLYAIVGLFELWTGAQALLIAGRRNGAVAYFAHSLASFVFLSTTFDFYTTGRLRGLYIVGAAGAVAGLLSIAYFFPEPPRRTTRTWRALWSVAVLGLLLAVVCLLGTSEESPLSAFGAQVLRLMTPVALLALVAALLGRLHGATGRERAELVAASWGLVAGPTVMAVLYILTIATGQSVVHLALPFIAPLLPLSVGFSLIRHNLLGTTAVITTRFILPPLVFVAMVSGLGSAMILSEAGAGSLSATVSLTAGAIAGAAAFVMVRPLLRRLFFKSDTRFRPSIEMLCDQLVSASEHEAVDATVGSVVRQWLPVRQARVYGSQDLGALQDGSEETSSRLMRGEKVWLPGTPWKRDLLIPMRTFGELRGVLSISPREDGALYTDEDLMLIDTIANLGAIALHNAQVRAELENARRYSIAAARDEKRLTIGLLSAEVAHEIAYPLNFFRHLLVQMRREAPLDSGDIEIGEEEVGRLERMLAALRRRQISEPQRTVTLLLGPLRRALGLVRDLVAQKRIEMVVEVPPGMEVVADFDALVQIFANLLRNGCEAAPPAGLMGVRAVQAAEADTVEVWDSGPGIAPGLERSLFTAWTTTKGDGTGLGLAVVQKLVGNLGWSIAVKRTDGRTAFILNIPRSGPSESETHARR